MSETVAEQIVAKVRTRLATITTGAGYQFTTPNVQRPLRFVKDRVQNLEIIVTIDSMPQNQALSYMGNPPVIARDMTVICACYGMVSETDTNSADTWRNRMFGAMSKAVTSVANWWTWDSLAINSRVGDPEYLADDGGQNVGVKLPVVITFRHSETDPYQVRG